MSFNRNLITVFFELIRKRLANVPQLVAERVAEVRATKAMTWDGTPIIDHLTPEDWKSFNAEFTEQFDQQNHRAFAITWASMVEERLRWLIETKFNSNLSIGRKKWIFTGTGTLGQFVLHSAQAVASHDKSQSPPPPPDSNPS